MTIWRVGLNNRQTIPLQRTYRLIHRFLLTRRRRYLESDVGYELKIRDITPHIKG